MSAPPAHLAALQALCEQRQLARVAKAARLVQVSEEAEQASSREIRSAHWLLEQSLAGPTFCPDQLILAAARLAYAEHEQACAMAALDNARAEDRAARKSLQKEGVRTEQLTVRAKQARRQLSRKSDDKRLADLQSLRAALGKGRWT